MHKNIALVTTNELKQVFENVVNKYNIAVEQMEQLNMNKKEKE